MSVTNLLGCSVSRQGIASAACVGSVQAAKAAWRRVHGDSAGPLLGSHGCLFWRARRCWTWTRRWCTARWTAATRPTSPSPCPSTTASTGTHAIFIHLHHCASSRELATTRQVWGLISASRVCLEADM